MNHIYHLSAFPKEPHGGNKAGVYLFADHLNKDHMQDIAKNIGYSETAFVLKSNLADFRLHFFTPNSEVDLCGHATIATFNLLRDLKIIEPGAYTQETRAGILKIRVEKTMVYMQQNPPAFGQFIDQDQLRKCFKGLIFHPQLKAQIVSTGLREIFLPVRDINTLNHIIANRDEIIRLSKKYNVIGIHVFALDDTIDAYGRNFGPLVGIDEESATGTSNGALAAYLFTYVKEKTSYKLRQGYSMNQPSEIHVLLSATNKNIVDVWVGGSAIIIET